LKLRVRGAALLALAAAIPAAASADSFTPVRLTIGAAPIARLHEPFAVTVRVTADAGALDTRTAPLRVRVKLATQCGGTFQYTSGVVLLDKPLSPQPVTGRPYSGVVRGSGRPNAYGSYVVCTYLEEQGDNRMFANDTSVQTNVSRACTTAAVRYDALRRSRSARRQRSRILAARRAARRACGPGVPL
jgi:hypothetical protein